MLRRFELDGESILRTALLGTLMLAYIGTLVAVLVAVAIYPFGDPAALLMQPDWLAPMLGHFALVDALLTMLFGPTAGIGLLALFAALLTAPRVYGWLRGRVDDLVFGQHDDAFALIAQVNPHLDSLAASQTLLPTIAATIAQSMKLPFVEIEALASEGAEMHAGR